jgi:hypothetical protein
MLTMSIMKKIKRFFLLALGVLVFIGLASIIYSNLTETRVSCCQGSAAGTLKSAVFAAQVQFQAATYLDDNKNGIGEYGYICQMSGETGVGLFKVGDLGLITGLLARAVSKDGTHRDSAYHFQVYLPNGIGGMMTYEEYIQMPDKKLGAALREKYYVVFAWPQNLEYHRRVYAITQSGHLQGVINEDIRDRALKQRSWRELFKLKEGSFEEIMESGPSKEWPFYSK